MYFYGLKKPSPNDRVLLGIYHITLEVKQLPAAELVAFSKALVVRLLRASAKPGSGLRFHHGFSKL
jgi:hypothetical protein